MPAWTSTGVRIVPGASPNFCPVTYIETNSVADDCMNVRPMSPLGAMSIDGKYVLDAEAGIDVALLLPSGSGVPRHRTRTSARTSRRRRRRR